jgi:hypothetical protein
MHLLASRWLLALTLVYQLSEPLSGAVSGPQKLALPAVPPADRMATPLRLVTAGGCPDEVQVKERLFAALPGVRLDGGASSLEVRLTDAGDSYSVSLPGVTRNFADFGRHCASRAEAAAVLIALLLSPPSLSAEPPAPPQPAAEEKSPVATPPAGPAPAAPVASRRASDLAVLKPPPRSRRPFHVLVEASAIGELALLSGDALAMGGDLRVFFGNDWLMLGLGGALMTPASLANGRASLLRVPFDLDARVVFRPGRVQLAAELGVFAGLEQVRGAGFPQPLTSTLIDGGLRVAPSLRFFFSKRVALLFSLPTSVAFKTYSLVENPQGPIAETPRLFGAAMLGLAVQTR